MNPPELPVSSVPSSELLLLFLFPHGIRSPQSVFPVHKLRTSFGAAPASLYGAVTISVKLTILDEIVATGS